MNLDSGGKDTIGIATEQSQSIHIVRKHAVQVTSLTICNILNDKGNCCLCCGLQFTFDISNESRHMHSEEACNVFMIVMPYTIYIDYFGL